MRKKRSNLFWFTIGVFLLFNNISLNLEAQIVKRQTIASYSSSVNFDDISIHQTVGQTYLTLSLYESGFSILPGFQQPQLFNSERIDSPLNFILPFEIFPNPASFYVIIKSPELLNKPTIQVAGLNGKLYLKAVPEDLNYFTINCSNWPNGLYIVDVIYNNQRISSSKLIINK